MKRNAHILMFCMISAISCTKDVVLTQCNNCPVAPPPQYIYVTNHNGVSKLFYSISMQRDTLTGKISFTSENNSKHRIAVVLPLSWMDREEVNARNDSFFLIHAEFIPYTFSNSGYYDWWVNNADSNHNAVFMVDSITDGNRLFARLYTPVENSIYPDREGQLEIKFDRVKFR